MSIKWAQGDIRRADTLVCPRPSEEGREAEYNY